MSSDIDAVAIMANGTGYASYITVSFKYGDVFFAGLLKFTSSSKACWSSTNDDDFFLHIRRGKFSELES